MTPQPPSLLRATAVGLAAGAVLLAAFVALGWRSLDAAWAGIDFNAALFEDFLGPYWQTAASLGAREWAPDKKTANPATRWRVRLRRPLRLISSWTAQSTS